MSTLMFILIFIGFGFAYEAGKNSSRNKKEESADEYEGWTDPRFMGK